MDIKCEAEMKVQLFESTEEDNKESNIHLEQLSTLEEIEERNCFGSIDVKNDIEVKEEPFDEEEIEVKEEPCDVKEEEIELKEEPFDFEKEDTTNDEIFDNICLMDQNQV
ncbi:UNVERIFIED_CONTAM: hypothetical protein RMT77_011598 [Armadillidium vulgare]